MALESTKDSEFLRHEPCPECGSRDALARYTNGSGHCYSAGCDYHDNGNGDLDPFEDPLPAIFSRRKLEMTGVVADIPDRRISRATCQKFGVTVEYDQNGEISKHHYPYYSLAMDADNSDIVGKKTRLVETKAFFASGDMKSVGLFGQNTCRGRGKFLTITEGELDALAVSEMFSRKWDVVSLRAGAGGAEKEIKEQLEWLEGYDQIVVCFDNDKAGKLAVDSIKDLFGPNKLKVCKLPLKDASEMLQANRVRDFTSSWWASKLYQPDGIIPGTETWERITGRMKVKSVPYPWSGLNTTTKGFRPFELVTITSGSGMGKSQVVRELEYYLLEATEDNVGVLALEEDISRTALGIMSIAADCPLHLEEDLDAEAVKPFWDQTLGTGRYYLFDHWGSTSEDNLMSRIRYMAKALDCKWIILDHLSIVVSSQENEDERRAIDAIMTKLRTLVQELGIGLFLVSHLRRATAGKAHEDGGRISLSELRGSQAIAQLSDIVIGLERNQQDDDEDRRNTVCVRVLKNRYSGLTGAACWLKYDQFTARLTECAIPEDDEDVADGF